MNIVSQRAWHRVMGRSSPFASLYSTSAKLRPLTFTHAGSIFLMASIMSQRAWHRVMQRVTACLAPCDRVMNIKEDNLYHKFPRSVDAFENAGRRSIIRGGDGNFYEKLEIPGKYGNHTGIFEYIKDSKGIIRHRFFKPL